MKKTYEFGLCEGRHWMPRSVKEGIFPERVEVIRQDLLEKRAEERIPADCGRLCIYVTGLTMAMLAVVKVCAKRGIHLTAYHYNKNLGVYTRQDVL